MEGAGIFNFISPQEALRQCKEMGVFFVRKGAASITMVTSQKIHSCCVTVLRHSWFSFKNHLN